MEHNFSVSVGKSGKYFKKYLSEDKYRPFLVTYSIAEIESIWNSVFGMCNLFQCTAVEFRKKQNFSYDFEQAKNSLNFLQHVRKLPVNAKEIYP